ncbi:DUF6197 family protein [Streptomyces prasinopilosus]|uniref:DUF6197 family protein n=1 Tax=Streptomyces prasinopilosus TaxID=67344 RepID=UPI00099EBC82|nr:hypothetical protein [Streptomyces prasinopilosus]
MTVTALRPSVDTTLDLETRLALVDAVMSVRLDEAAVAYEVRTAHLPGADPVLPRLTPTAAPNPCRTPIAGLLHRARTRLETGGWCRDALYDESGAVCPIRAIRLEAAGRDQTHDACVLLLDAIQQAFPGAETIPSWNAAQTSPAPVLRAFDRATDHAHNRGL